MECHIIMNSILNNNGRPRRINPTIFPGDEIDLSGKYSFISSEIDSMLYTITTKGELVKINPKTRVASLVKKRNN